MRSHAKSGKHLKNEFLSTSEREPFTTYSEDAAESHLYRNICWNLWNEAILLQSSPVRKTKIKF